MPGKATITQLRLSGSELDALIEELNRAATENSGPSKREMRRWSMTGDKAVLTIADSVGAKKHLLIIPRDISTSGMGCLNGVFIHLGTNCVVSLRDRHGKTRSLVGTVARCQHLKGSVHEVGIRFKDPINPEEFREFHNEHIFHRESVQLDKLRGHILVIEESMMDQKLYAAFFKNTSIELSFAKDAKSGVAMLSESPDLVIVNSMLSDKSGLDLIGEICDSGYAKPILLMSTDSSAATRTAALQAGASEVLIKPVTADLFHRAAAEYLMGGSGRGPIHAVRDASVISNEMVDEFVQELHKLAHELNTLIRANAYDDVRARTNMIKGSASGYGFKGVTEVAEAAMRTLDATMSIEESTMQLRELISACQRTVPSSVAGAGDELAE
ncbi:MAG: response regulator [Phycisphaeraceae bacterium]|nr:response regulator [Phycisphaerales bacterium]MCB9843433.1 response regulator [Phycisphaeraceae bacterium]